MASPADVDMAQAQAQAQPFTVEENIAQLNAIDASIVQLVGHAATALGALTTPGAAAQGAAGPAMDPPAQKEAFRSATDAFLTTLHGVDVGMKRQVLALEEAGIVRLSSSQKDPGSTAKSSLRPNGVGLVGHLDVGWLNSRGTQVERDMEAELWSEAREFLEGATVRAES